MQKIASSLSGIVASSLLAASAAYAASSRTRPDGALLLYPACPCYHLLGEGTGATRVDARINLDGPRRFGLRLSAELTDSSGKLLQTASADASKPEIGQ